MTSERLAPEVSNLRKPKQETVECRGLVHKHTASTFPADVLGETMTQKDIKRLFKEQDLRLAKGTMDLIQEELWCHVNRLAKRSKEGLGSYKTLTPQLFHIALGRTTQ